MRCRFLQGRPDRDRGRWGLRHGGGDLPVEVCRQGHSGAPPQGVPRFEDHAGAREQANIELLTPYAVERFEPGENGALSIAKLINTETGELRDIPITGAFIAVGHEPQSTLVEGQIDLDANGYVKVEGRSTRTNRPGVFAAGDLVDHTYRQAITAAGSGCQAALDAEWYLRDTPEVP